MGSSLFGDLLDEPEAEPIELRAHQEEALVPILRALTLRPGQVAPNGLRALVQLATGTGKSFLGAVAGQRLVPHGPVLVVVPTLDLLVQMIGSWKQAGRKGNMAAVCSLVADELPLDVPGTTSPLQIAHWIHESVTKRRPLTLFCTYTSAGAVADAYEAWLEKTGAALAPLGLMLLDEAHRSSGSLAKKWAIVHEQGRITAERRLYMTATPRIWMPPKRAAKREGAHDPLPEELAVSMDDPAVYGRQVHTLGLAEAVDRGLLAPFEIVVLELRDPGSDRAAAETQPVPWGAGAGEAEDGSEDELPVERIAAIQAGLLKVCSELGLERCITFHNRTLEARYFSETMNQTVERLHDENPGTYPPEVWAQWLSGEHRVDYRKDVLEDFGRSVEHDGLSLRIISSCKVLGEGVDMPNADSILLQGRGSMVDIVQAIGRALRLNPGEGKIARIVVPIFLKKGEKPGEILESDSYGPLVKILTALRSHDARVVEALAVPQNSGRRTSGRSAEAAFAPGEGAGGSGSGAFTLPVRFQSKVGEDALALFVASRVLTGEGAYWREGIAHCYAWNEKYGDLDVPYAEKVPIEDADGNVTGLTFPLGKWISDRRAEYSEGEMPGHRVDQLESLGMIWAVSAARFEMGLSWARTWAREHYGSLAVPARALIGNDFALGQWLARLRTAAEVPAGEPGELNPEWREALAEIDPYWAPRWPIAWQRAYVAARTWWQEADGRVDWAALTPETVFEGEQLGHWVAAQRGMFADLEQEQQDLLVAIGIEEDPALAQAAAVKKARKAAAAGRPKKPAVSQADRFALGVAALAQFVAREGRNRPVPRAHVEVLERVVVGPDAVETTETTPIKLGSWVGNQRTRRGSLSEEQIAALAEHGLVLG